MLKRRGDYADNARHKTGLEKRKKGKRKGRTYEQPASITSTETSVFSARRPATTLPAVPPIFHPPQCISVCPRIIQLRRSFILRLIRTTNNNKVVSMGGLDWTWLCWRGRPGWERQRPRCVQGHDGQPLTTQMNEIQLYVVLILIPRYVGRLKLIL